MQATAGPDTPAPVDRVPPGRARPPSLRLELTWHGQIVDIVPAHGRRWRRHRLSVGGVLAVAAREGHVEVRLDGGPPRSLALGDRLELAPGAQLALVEAAELRRALFRPRVDSLLLNALMLAAAVQVVVVSALWLTPEPDDDPGAGWRIQELRHYLRPASGSAPKKGEGAVIRVGRKPQEAERPTPESPQRGVGPSPVRAVHPVTLADALAALDRAVQGGARGMNLRETIGDAALSTANAPTEGAGLGGLLTPRNLVDVGAGSGIIGIGQSRIRPVLEARRLEDDEPFQKLRRRPVVVQPQDTSHREDAGGDNPEGLDELDPVVRDQLTRAVRRRQSNVRYCYETWALQANPHRTGRVVLRITLQPDGYVGAATLEHDDPAFGLMAECVERMAAQWYLGDGLVDAPVQLAFPFILQPKHQSVIDFSDEPVTP